MSRNDRFEIKSGGGCLALFGMPFLLAGLSVIIFTFVPQEVRGGDPIPIVFGIAFGSIFALVGGTLVCGRSKLRIDKLTGKVSKRWSVLITLYKKEYELKSFERVLITKEIRSGDKSSRTVFPVYLEGTDKLNIQETEKHLKSRQLSEDLSKFLNFDVCDSSSGEEAIRLAGTMDKSVRDQIGDSGEDISVPTEPKVMISDSYMSGDSLVVEIPPVGFSPFTLVALVPLFFIIPFFIGFSGFFVAGDSATSAPVFVKYIFGGFASLFFLAPLYMLYKVIIAPIFTKVKIELSRYEFKHIKSGLITRTTVMNCDEIEELFIEGEAWSLETKGAQLPPIFKTIGNSLGKGSGIIVRSDAKNIKFGTYLSREEKEYIIAVMKHTMTT